MLPRLVLVPVITRFAHTIVTDEFALPPSRFGVDTNGLVPVADTVDSGVCYRHGLLRLLVVFVERLELVVAEGVKQLLILATLPTGAVLNESRDDLLALINGKRHQIFSQVIE